MEHLCGNEGWVDVDFRLTHKKTMPHYSLKSRIIAQNQHTVVRRKPIFGQFLHHKMVLQTYRTGAER